MAMARGRCFTSDWLGILAPASTLKTDGNRPRAFEVAESLPLKRVVSHRSIESVSVELNLAHQTRPSDRITPHG